MKHFKQESAYGCGLYSIANALQDRDIITEHRIARSENGNNIGQLNRWLQESEYDCWIGMLKYDNENPIQIFDLKPNFEVDNRVLWFPFFIVITSTKEKNHMLGCRYMRNGNIIVHDSLQESETIFDNFDQFEKHYKGLVLSFECLYSFENKVISIIKQ